MLLAIASVQYESDFTRGANLFEALMMGLAGKHRLRLRAVDIDPGMPNALEGEMRATVLVQMYAMCSARSVDLVVEPSCLLRSWH